MAVTSTGLAYTHPDERCGSMIRVGIFILVVTPIAPLVIWSQQMLSSASVSSSSVALRVASAGLVRALGLGLINPISAECWPTGVVRALHAARGLRRLLPAGGAAKAVRKSFESAYELRKSGQHSLDQYLRPFQDDAGSRTFDAHVAGLDGLELTRIEQEASTLLVRTVVVAGDSDPIVPLASCRRLQSSLPSASLDVVVGGRHFLPEESPERVASALRSVLVC